MNSLSINKEKGNNNPIIAQRFMADPYAIEYDGRIYVYGSNDSDSLYKDVNCLYNKNSYSNIKSINCVSSADLINWLDHGEIQVADDEKKGAKGAASWAGNSWAPAICFNKVKDNKDGEIKTKFFLYFANSAASIGVLTSDSPTGPWVDPLGKPMITKDTPGCSDVEWLFDPAVLVEEDGSAYIYFGGGVPNGREKNPGTARVARLSSDMISIEGEAVMIDAPLMFEDSGINIINGKYYYSYCINWSKEAADTVGMAQIAYMVSDNPMGPFEYKGIIMNNPGQSPNFDSDAWGNNHHCMLWIKDKLYMFYHAPQYQIDKKIGFNDSKSEGCAYRTTYIDIVNVHNDGTVTVDNMTKTGTAERLLYVDPYVTNNAAAFAWAKDVVTDYLNDEKGENTGNTALLFTDSDGWTGVSGVDFGDKTAKEVFIKYAATKQCAVKIYIDDIEESNLAAELLIGSTGSLSNYADNITSVQKSITGIHDLFISTQGVSEGTEVILSTWRFTK